jgi:hypothetical protein
MLAHHGEVVVTTTKLNRKRAKTPRVGGYGFLNMFRRDVVRGNPSNLPAVDTLFGAARYAAQWHLPGSELQRRVRCDSGLNDS